MFLCYVKTIKKLDIAPVPPPPPQPPPQPEDGVDSQGLWHASLPNDVSVMGRGGSVNDSPGAYLCSSWEPGIWGFIPLRPRGVRMNPGLLIDKEAS